jgi:PAS domain S-box-containing protein
MTDPEAIAKIRAAFELTPTVLSVSDLEEGRLLEVNDAFLRITGYARDEVIGRRIEDLGFWINPDERRQGLELLRAGGTVRDLEARFRTKAGAEVVALAYADLVDVGGRQCVITALMDITPRVRAEAAQREFLAMLGHELRNPLGTIAATLGVLNRLATEDAEVRRMTGIIGRQTAHLTRLVDDLLDVARVTSGKIEIRSQTIDLYAVAARTVEAMREAGRTAEHDVTVDGEPVTVYGDPARLEQVAYNLVDNAIKYTPAGGQVRVTVRRKDGDAVLRVRDTGEGIRTDLVDRVFDMFVQQPQGLDRSRGGLGLGLTLVKRLVELHEGSVAVASDGPGRGSEFTVRLPVSTRQLGRHDAAPSAPDPAPQRLRVLIAEDNADARDSLQLLIELAGHEVEAAEDGPGALEKIRAVMPDVAVIDIGLPGMDGYAVARAVRQDPVTRSVRLVALTGYGQADDKKRALDAGFDVHVAKPVDPEKLAGFLDGGPDVAPRPPLLESP